MYDQTDKKAYSTPGMPQLGVAGFTLGVLALALAAWLIFFRGPQVPACTDPDVVASLQAMMRQGTNHLLDFGRPPPTIRVSALREVGFASDLKQRGCMASIMDDDSPLPFAFVIGPDHANPGGMRITGAHPKIVAARFGNLDRAGRHKYSAEPIGRESIAQLLRSGVDRIYPHYGAQQKVAELMRRLSPQYVTPLQARPDAARTQRIAEVELTASCRQSGGGDRYICPLIIEYNSPLSLLFLAPSVIEADFIFERHPGSGTWTLAEDFKERFDKASLAARQRARGTDRLSLWP